MAEKLEQGNVRALRGPITTMARGFMSGVLVALFFPHVPLALLLVMVCAGALLLELLIYVVWLWIRAEESGRS